jgi:hypothetical protein
MRSHGHGNVAQTRRRIAVEAARLIAEQGVRDFHAAKHKAAANLGLGDASPLPRNSEIDDALREHQRLFQSESQPRQLARLREAAIEAMRFFSSFEPRLVGAVLEGTADAYSAVCLHLFTDNPDTLAVFLADKRIPSSQEQRTLRLSAESSAEFPAWRFSAGDVNIDLTVFPLNGLRQPPLDRISDRPMRRAGLDAVIALDDGA